MRFWLADEDETRAAGAALAPTLISMASAAPVVVFIRGNLGAGKSTLVRGVLSEIGVKGVMPSPTYTLVEPYQVGALKVFHMDAYRLADGAELDYLGLDDINEPGSVLLVEWPDHVSDALPEPSMTVDLEVAPHPHDIESEKRDKSTGVLHMDRRADRQTDRQTDCETDREEGVVAQEDTPGAGNWSADPGRLLTITVNAMSDQERERLLTSGRWSMLTRVVT